MPDLYSLFDSAGTILPNFNFMLRVNGIDDVPLKSVRAFSRENEYDYIQEGGLNDFVHMRRKPVSKPFTLVCERYIPTQFNDPLSNGTELTLPLMLFVGRNVGRKFNAGAALRYYVFTSAVVMSKEYGQLDAEHSGLLTETVTIGYSRMFCITNPLDEDDQYEAWQMNEDLDPDSTGNTKQKYSKNGKTPLANMEKKRMFVENAYKWAFDEDDVTGNGQVSAARNPKEKELSKGDMVNNRRSYNFGAENNVNFTGDAKSVRSAQNSLYSDKKLGENLGIKELTADEMAAKARKFLLTDREHYAGNKMLSSRRNDDTKEPHLEEMIGKASKWKFDGTSKEGAGVQHGQNAVLRDSGTANEDGVAGRGAKELSKQEMEANASLRPFGGINEPVKDEFAEAAKKWEFDGTSKEGKGTRNRQNANQLSENDISGIGVTEASKDKMAKVAHKWAFTDKYTKNGNNVISGKKASDVGIKENNIDEMEGRASLWEFSGNAKDGNGQGSRQNAKVEGTGENSNVSGMGVTELSKGEFVEAAAKWEFTDQYTKEGGGVASRNRDAVSEQTKEELMDKAQRTSKFTTPAPSQPKARMWQFAAEGGSAKEGGGTSSRAMPRTAEATKQQMAGKAVHHVKRTIEDFLMK